MAHTPSKLEIDSLGGGSARTQLAGSRIRCSCYSSIRAGRRLRSAAAVVVDVPIGDVELLVAPLRGRGHCPTLSVRPATMAVRSMHR